LEFRVKVLIVAVILLVASSAAAELTSAIDTTIAPFERSIWFIHVEDESAAVLYGRNSQTLAIPASTRKLFSGAASAHCLGLQRQLETEFWLNDDDVVLRGDGDPAFGSDRYGHEQPFAPLIRELQRRRRTSVRDVIADVSLFDRVTIPYSWKVGNLATDSATPVDAVAYRENEIDNAAVPSPPIFAALAMRDALEEAGINVTGSIRLATEPAEWKEFLTSVDSPFVQHLLYAVFKNSHNLYAEMLLKRTSADGAEPASYPMALENEEQFLIGSVGIGKHDFRFVDGSGLSPDDLVTPAAVTKMLRWMYEPPRRGVFWDLLAAPGGEGTLRSRLKEVGDRMRAKTGSVAGVNSLAGIVTGRDGRARFFFIAVNHHTGVGGSAIGAIDRIAEAIADF
jgi:serine-type D-Ala-D-Ala carboxypeptidase/endopeptidase (penicillin-binding protein 4)